MTRAWDIAVQIKELLESLQRPALAPYLSDWPRSPERRAVQACDLAVLRWLPQIGGDAAAFGIDLVASVVHAAPLLAWRQSYSAQEAGAAFLDNYGWSEIFGEHGPLASERIACGFLHLGTGDPLSPPQPRSGGNIFAVERRVRLGTRRRGMEG